MSQEYDAPSSGSQQTNTIIMLVAAVLLLAAAGLVVMKGGKTPAKQPDIADQDDSEDADSEAEDSGPKKAKWDQKELEELVEEAASDYRKFIKAERENDRDRRRTFFKRAKVKLQAFMDRVNALDAEEVKDTALVKRATELLYDVNKRARTDD